MKTHLLHSFVFLYIFYFTFFVIDRFSCNLHVMLATRFIIKVVYACTGVSLLQIHSYADKKRTN